MSRWKYKTATVAVGENSQTVRQMTADERAWLAGERAKLGDPKKADRAEQMRLQRELVQRASINPELTDQDVKEMPSDLVDACAGKIMELTLGPDWNKSDGDEDGAPEKKASEDPDPGS